MLNLACGSATIENGLLGPEVLYNGQIAPPQLPRAAAATHAKLIIVSVGADDLSWSVMTQLCAAAAVCDDKVSSAYFTQLLNTSPGTTTSCSATWTGCPGTRRCW